MWNKISLRIRIFVIVAALACITVGGGLVTTWYTYRIETLFSDIIDRDVAAFEAAEALENALVNQKGFVSYYFLDGNPDWLKQLGEYRQVFRQRLGEVRSTIGDEEERAAVDRIEAEYRRYIDLKDQVIEYYRLGERDEGREIHNNVRVHFFRILELCEQFKVLHKDSVADARERSRLQARRLRIGAASAIFLVVVLAGALAFVLINNILTPIRRLAMEADREGVPPRSDNEVKALSHSVKGLIEDVDRTRESLLQAEKMALVGKLAAGTAHSIRNPLTSLKMRLFSLSRSLELTPVQKEDFEVISEEIRHIDTIVRNFLEFSRPPKLKMHKVSPSDVVDTAIQLLKHRLLSYNVDVVLVRPRRLPAVRLDPEQVKETVVNLVVNACEAMAGGGNITIQEETGFSEPLGRVALIRLTDDGPGIPETLRDKIFQPFFTTREEGTGLGLSIAKRILEQHGGRLDLISTESGGATFVITLPVTE
ncbi:MAG: MCP four helix bundle domain-containing protein [Deltaproteobacteria bacterium]|nr:MCP four helix bundle domain-containing protein [Deltaproteobacteria bacterium]